MARGFPSRHKGKDLLIYADSESSADMLYATRFHAGDPFIFLRTRDGKRHLVMSDLEIDRARKQSNAHRVHSLTHYTRAARDKYGARTGITEILLTTLKDFGIRRVYVPASFPLAVADGLRRHRVTVRVIADPLFPERIYKTAQEMRAIAKTMRATQRAMRLAVDTLKRARIERGYLFHRGKRLTAEKLRSIIDTSLMSEGFVAADTIVAPGRQGCDPHERGHGPLRAHQPIILDIFPRASGSHYFADMTRTVVRGHASPYLQRMYRAVLDAQRMALRMVRPGVESRAIHQAITTLFAARGFETGEMKGRMQGFFHGTGHGLGLEIHEPPRIAINATKLEAGMVITIEPGLYYYPHGGVRIEDTVVVTRDGIRNLTRFSKALEI